MLTELGLRNFKAFGDTEQKAPMSKITLIYGPNSSGKSSIIQALLMLKQSAGMAYIDSKYMGRLITRGQFADLGSYSALLHKHDPTKNLEIRIACDYHHGLSYDVFMRIGEDRLGSEITEHSARVSEAVYRMIYNGEVYSEYKLKYDGTWHIDALLYGVNVHMQVPDYFQRYLLPRPRQTEEQNQSERRNVQIRNQREREREQRRNAQIRNQREQEPERRNTQIRSQRERERERERERRNDQTNNEQQDPRLLEIPMLIQTKLDSTIYVGPLRGYPERLYKVLDASSSLSFSGVKGEFTLIRLHHQPELLRMVNEWFEKFEINLKLEVATLGTAEIVGEHVSLILTDKNTETRVTLPDVGFGVNQVLPIIVEGVDFLSDNYEKILCVEQPEIHIHPRLQAHLADLMIETTRGEGYKQWIVETHSELLILRLQRRIKEGKINSKDVSVLYVRPQGADGSTIQQLRLDENGAFIDHWPDGFFDEGFNELMA